MKLRTTTLIFALLLPLLGASDSISNSLGMRLIRVDGGRFIRGTDGGERRLALAFPMHINAQYFGNAESPAHPTWITKPYYLADKEVTVGQWKRFLAESGYTPKTTTCVGWRIEKEKTLDVDFERSDTYSWKQLGFSQDDHHPVVGINRLDVQAFLDWLSKKEGVHYRLPTETEWEYACRAGTDTWFSFGNEIDGIVHKKANLANVELEKHRANTTRYQWMMDFDRQPSDPHVFTAPVGSYPPNAWGFYDLHGNVWEWCDDLWLDTVYKPYERSGYQSPVGIAKDPKNGDQPQTDKNDFRVIRGGAWCTGPVIARSANRSFWDARDAACYIGFRVARDAEGTSSANAAYIAEQKARKAVELVGGRFYSNKGLDLEIRFEGDGLDERVLSALRFIPELERIRINPPARDFKLGQDGLQALADLTELRELNLSCNITLDTIDLTPLVDLPHLEVLHFARVASLEDRHLAMLRGTTNLRKFTCYGAGSEITDAGIRHLAGNTRLTHLEIHEHRANGSFLQAFTSCPLTSLSVSAKDPSQGLFLDEHTAVLTSFATLEQLHLSREPQLTEKTIGTISKLTALRELSLESNAGIAPNKFGGLANLQKLQHLNLKNTQAGDAATKAIAQIPRLSSLRMGSSNLTDAGLRTLENCFSINTMELSVMNATDEGIKSLGRINRLRRLDLGSPHVTGSGLGPISRLPELDDLKLRCPQLTDVAFDYLSQAKSIQKLRLVERGVKPPAALTDKGLAKMAKATWLKELWLPRNDTGLTEDYINELKQLMPKTGVIPYTVQWQ